MAFNVNITSLVKNGEIVMHRLNKKKNSELGTLLPFDYIGASTTTLQQGSGGLSVRDRKLSLQCCTPGGFDIEWEDTYFALLWWLYPPAWRGKGGKETARSFRNRSFLNKRSLGARQGNRGLLLNKSQLIEFRE